MSKHSLIALVLRDHDVEWTVLQHRKSRMEITQQKRVELEWPEAVTDHRSPEAAAHLKTKLPPLSGHVGISIPAHRVLMRVVELPSSDPEELEGMAELQIDKISPFPSDQMALALEVLEQGEDMSRVLIAAVQHDYIDHLGEFLLMAGLYPQSVDVDILGWWALIHASGRCSGEGQEIVMLHDGASAQLLVIRDGSPVVIRALDADIDPGKEAMAAEVAVEVEYTLMSMEGIWGSQAVSTITLWMNGSPPDGVIEALSQACGVDVQAARLDELPPLSEGLSRRMARRDLDTLDLAPSAWKQSIQSRKFQRRAVTLAATALVIWGVLMGGLWFWADQQKVRLAKAQNEMLQLQNEVAAVRELKSQVTSLQQYADRTASGLECLREVSTLLPGSVDITSFTYNKEAEVNLRGEADSDRPINDFISNLEQSDLFTSVRTEAITTRQRQGQNRSIFRVTMTLPAPVEEEDPGS